MSIVGLSQGEQDNILRMLAGILWIGNVEFKVDQEGRQQTSCPRKEEAEGPR